MSDLKLTTSILNVVEGVGWISLIGCLPLAKSLLDTLPTDIAAIVISTSVIGSLGYIAAIRTAKAVVVIAENTSAQQLTNWTKTEPQLGHRGPSGYAGGRKAGQVIKTYKGVEITAAETGVTALDQNFAGIIAAEKAIDSR